MKKTIYILISILAINIVGLYYQWYLSYSWFDLVLHFSSGFFIAMLLSAYLKDHLFDGWKLKNFLIILGAVSFIGVVWEFSEYIANFALSPIIYDHYRIRTYFMGDLDDTMSDLLMDILGSGLFALILGVRTRTLIKLRSSKMNDFETRRRRCI